MGERKEYLISGLSDEDLERMATQAGSDLGAREFMTIPKGELYEGLAVNWQAPSDERCITIYPGHSTVHADQIDTDSELGKLLEELTAKYPSLND